jgi:hypothetical protein
MSKSTVVSLLPIELNETKPGIYPGIFVVPAAKGEDFEILNLANSVAHVYMDESRGSMTIVQESEVVAKSIVDDYINSCIAVDKTTSVIPGLFWVEGELSKAEIKTKFADKLAAAKVNQSKWFHALVKMADDDWSRNRSHKSITPLQKLAATSLEQFVGKKEWASMVDVQAYKACKFCTSQIPSEALVCQVCSRAQVPDSELAKLISTK